MEELQYNATLTTVDISVDIYNNVNTAKYSATYVTVDIVLVNV